MSSMNSQNRPLRRIATGLLVGLTLFAACTFASGRAAAERIRIGMVRTTGGGPVFIAQEKGYFAAEDLTAEIVFFETAQPIAIAVVSGDIDFGLSGVTAAFYSLAGQGAAKIIGGYIRDVPGFASTAYIVANRAYAAGLRSYGDFGGRSVALPTMGSPPHYCLGLLADKYGFELKSLRLMQLQSNANQVSAVIGGQVDVGVVQSTVAMPAIAHGDVKLLGYCGDETPWQLGLIFTATHTANERGAMIARFLRVYRKGAREYDNAFAAPDGSRKDGSTASEIVPIIAKYIGQPVELIERGITYVDPEARIDVKDVLHQIDWYRSQNLLKGQFDSQALIDSRYAVALPVPMTSAAANTLPVALGRR